MIEGVKELTLENWDKPDEMIFYFDPEGKNIYLKRILDIVLSEPVPLTVRNLFEVARNAMIYGYFYYPLYTLAVEQIHRVGECAIKEKAKQSNCNVNEKTTFNQCLELLKKCEILDDESFKKWESMKSLRNHSSHPDKYTLLPTEMIIQYVKNFAEIINRLFQTNYQGAHYVPLNEPLADKE